MKKKLTIGIDIRDLQLAQTGTKTYLEELCTAFREIKDPQYTFHFIDTDKRLNLKKGKVSKYTEHLRYQLWKQIILPYKAWCRKCDILFCTDNFVPLLKLGYQTVPVFHDAFFFENPEHYGKLWLKLYHKTAIPAARRSAFIVTPTRYAQQQIHAYTGIPLAQLKVVYEGPKKMIKPEADPILEQLHLQPGRYILHVGSMYKRKNIPALVYAFKLLKDSGEYAELKLVLAGPTPGGKDSNDLMAILEAVESTGLGADILLSGYLSDAALAVLYRSALLYIFPSLNEGFGIPILEAFQYQLPVLVADNTCLPEVGGDAVLQFNPYDSTDMAAKMKMVIEDETLRTALIQKGQQRLKLFSWQKAAAQLLELFSGKDPDMLISHTLPVKHT